MRMFARCVALLIGLSWSGWAVQDAHATTAVYLSEVEHASLSDAIVLGTLGAQRTERDPVTGRIWTYTIVRVDKPLYGAAPAELEVSQIGGTLGTETLHIEGDATLAPGEAVCLFLRHVEGRWYLTALEQSKYSLVPSLDGMLLERSLGGGLFLRGEQGELTPFDDDSEDHPMTVARLAWILADAQLAAEPTTGDAQ